MTRTMELYVRDPEDRAPEYRVGEIHVATADVIWSTTIEPPEDDDDPCDPRTTVYKIRLRSIEDADNCDLIEAIRWTHRTKGGCGHDWDCCGCRSYYVGDIFFAGFDIVFEVHSSRNF